MACGKPPLIPELPALFRQQCAESTSMTDRCEHCVHLRCCNSLTSIAQDADGIAYVNCAVGCADSSMCLYQCAQKHRHGYALSQELESCGLYHCSDECNFTQCLHCSVTKCTTEAAACDKVPECSLIGRCRRLECARDDYQCYARCQSKYSAGSEADYRLTVCTWDHCGPTCLE